MTNRNQKVKDNIQEILFSYFNTDSFEVIRNQMKRRAKYEYGCRTATLKLGKGIELTYTDNPNCFASLIIHLQGVGMVGSYAMTYQDLTRAGKLRGCDNHNHYIFE